MLDGKRLRGPVSIRTRRQGLVPKDFQIKSIKFISAKVRFIF